MSAAQEPGTISIVAKAWQCQLIDQAADYVGLTRGAFVLNAACRQAEDVLLDQASFTLNEEKMTEFWALLDCPPEPTESLLRLLGAATPWTEPG